jgi:hypothetical protein
MGRVRQSLYRVALAAAIAGCGGAESAASANPMLQRWCDAHPCAWDVHGEVKRVGTWHPDDFAAELVSDDASLSQLRADHAPARCLLFSLMAQVDERASAFLELDFLDDGDVEFSARIPKSDWEVRTFAIAAPTWYEGVRFTIRKAGPGRVILAELNVTLAQSGCPTTPLALDDRPLDDRPSGAGCENDSQCTSGHCPILSAGGTCD